MVLCDESWNDNFIHLKSISSLPLIHLNVIAVKIHHVFIAMIMVMIDCQSKTFMAEILNYLNVYLLILSFFIYLPLDSYFWDLLRLLLKYIVK